MSSVRPPNAMSLKRTLGQLLLGIAGVVVATQSFAAVPPSPVASDFPPEAPIGMDTHDLLPVGPPAQEAPISLSYRPTAALRAHELFGFAPYWTLGGQAGFDVRDLSTVAYFGVDVAADGSLIQGGAGWLGYRSQSLVDLIDRAHASCATD